ncbi:ROK family protein [Nonomuraea jabiensis]|uniref:ROK family protein n=1 Tax=Nonomuraea jabiensis TaxID=882448 RepID=A0A7W9L8X7_9ACTN|nr:ROK family protein [Nonomuraea jabiensis]MBB5774971.1 hypothetical protein [Nonomuraea jabiensis]
MSSRDAGPAARHRLAVDIGGTTWAAGVLERGSLRVVGEGPTGHRHPRELADLRETVRSWAAAAGPEATVGVSFPGATDGSGVVTAWPNRPDWTGSRLSSVLGLDDRAHLDIIDDGAAAIRGEMSLGAARDVRDLLVLTLGTGMGGGFLLDSGVRNGLPGDARTLGHIRALASSRACSCGRRGCLQTALAALPADDVLLERGTAAWPDGEGCLNVLADLARVLGIRRILATGGLLRRTAVRRFVRGGFAARGLECVVPERPERSSLLGALVRGTS